MIYKKLQSKVEEAVYESIENIAEELKLKIPYYPEVYLIRKNSLFEPLGLQESERKDFNLAKKGRNVYPVNPKVILIRKFDEAAIAEESGHFLHFANSKINYYKQNYMEKFTTRILMEAIGFFCSKLIVPERKTEFEKYPDSLEENDNFLKKLKKNIDKDINNYYLTLYSQGYSLGEKLFDYYISKNIPEDYPKKLIKKNFKRKYSSIRTFMKLKYSILV